MHIINKFLGMYRKIFQFNSNQKVIQLVNGQQSVREHISIMAKDCPNIIEQIREAKIDVKKLGLTPKIKVKETTPTVKIKMASKTINHGNQKDWSTRAKKIEKHKKNFLASKETKMNPKESVPPTKMTIENPFSDILSETSASKPSTTKVINPKTCKKNPFQEYLVELFYANLGPVPHNCKVLKPQLGTSLGEYFKEGAIFYQLQSQKTS